MNSMGCSHPTHPDVEQRIFFEWSVSEGTKVLTRHALERKVEVCWKSFVAVLLGTDRMQRASKSIKAHFMLCFTLYPCASYLSLAHGRRVKQSRKCAALQHICALSRSLNSPFPLASSGVFSTQKCLFSSAPGGQSGRLR